MIITTTPTAEAYGGIESLVRPTLEEHLKLAENTNRAVGTSGKKP